MLKSLRLQNFRGFLDHKIEFGPENVLIGQNNAGKTTVIEALRALSVAQTRVHNANFERTPQWVDKVCRGAGFRLVLDVIDFDFSNIHHLYKDQTPATITAKLRNNNEVSIYIGKDRSQVYCQIRKGADKVVHSRGEVGALTFGMTKVMPPIGSLLPHEKQIAKDRLIKYLDGYLAYRHFRNQLWERVPDYRLFRKLLEDTWRGLKIQDFDNDAGESKNEFFLSIRDGKFPAEISWHGHGLQAWAQTVWFLARTTKVATVVLDEPDVYLHADLQRKLIKVIEGLGFRQSIIATHSPEIISDVPFQHVIVVQKTHPVSKPADKALQIQASLRGMGSLHSIQLSKIAQRGLILFVEGDDKPFLLDVAYKIGGRAFDNFSQLAVQETQGKGNWKLALGAAQNLHDVSEGDVQTALLLDRDYMLDEEVLEYRRQADKHHLIMKIWDKKEIENYFISADVIARFIANRLEGPPADLANEIENEIIGIEALVEEDLILNFADVIKQRSKKLMEPKTAFTKAKAHVKQLSSSGRRVRDIYSGKAIISKLSKVSQDKYGISFSPLGLCKEIRGSEMDSELRDFVSGICKPGPHPIALFAEDG